MEIPFARLIIMMFIFIYSMLQISLLKSFVMLPFAYFTRHALFTLKYLYTFPLLSNKEPPSK